jgi:AraC family transcriptional regulator of adaptative response/methylated-DNA-[protein]-cysteine methyltransferase
MYKMIDEQAVRQAAPAALAIHYTLTPCPQGRLLVAATTEGLCAIALGESDQPLEASLKQRFPKAALRRDDAALRRWVKPLLEHLRGKPLHLQGRLDLHGTPFQQRVWEELRKIPTGQTRTYTQVAHAVGKPRSVRAVARACATNPLGVVVPCHRVIREDGGLGGYRWGLEVKKKLLALEQRLAASAPIRVRGPRARPS